MMRNWIRPALVVTALVSATAVRAADGGPSILSVGSNLSDRFGPGPFARFGGGRTARSARGPWACTRRSSCAST